MHALSRYGKLPYYPADYPLHYPLNHNISPFLAPSSLAVRLRPSLSGSSQLFSSKSALLFADRSGEQVQDPPRKEPETAGSEEGKDSAKPESDQGESQRSSGTGGQDSAKDAGKEESKGENGKEKKKEPPPPPPPHGDKSPWQVFTETLNNEFKASKEWNESTKALASSAHQFTENESIKRARAAYQAASGAASSTTSSALRTTGKVLGQSAAWTWDTPVVKGVRAGVSATGKGIEKVTRPVRETEAYRKAMGGVKDVIDDGSSSRYGGWIEKEERRKQRELREQKEASAGGRGGRPAEKMEEDPKYVSTQTLDRSKSSHANCDAALGRMSLFTRTRPGKNHGDSFGIPTG